MRGERPEADVARGAHRSGPAGFPRLAGLARHTVFAVETGRALSPLRPGLFGLDLELALNIHVELALRLLHVKDRRAHHRFENPHVVHGLLHGLAILLDEAREPVDALLVELHLLLLERNDLGVEHRARRAALGRHPDVPVAHHRRRRRRWWRQRAHLYVPNVDARRRLHQLKSPRATPGRRARRAAQRAAPDADLHLLLLPLRAPKHLSAPFIPPPRPRAAPARPCRRHGKSRQRAEPAEMAHGRDKLGRAPPRGPKPRQAEHRHQERRPRCAGRRERAERQHRRTAAHTSRAGRSGRGGGGHAGMGGSRPAAGSARRRYAAGASICAAVPTAPAPSGFARRRDADEPLNPWSSWTELVV